MMSLGARLLITLSVSLALLWSATAAWQMWHLRIEVQQALDQRLMASAQMVAGLMSRMPPQARASIKVPATPALVPGQAGIACLVSSIRGEVVAQTSHGPASQLSTVPLGFSTQMIAGQHWRVYSHTQAGFRVTTADRIHKRRALLANILRAAGLPFVVAVIGSMLALWLGVRRGLRPLQRLRRELKQRSPDSLSPLQAPALPRELAPFVNTLNQLLNRVRDALARERRLTNDAAHELRTPLTAIRTHLQVARLQATGSNPSRRALEQADTGARRLQHTLQQMLALARITNGQVQPVSASTHIAHVIRAATLDTDQSSRVVVLGHPPNVRIAIAETLAISALRNLLDNALRFSPAGSRVSIQCVLQPNRLTMRIRDHGPGVPTGKRHQLTERFRRDLRGHGSGLGLAIVAAIAEQVDAKLWFEEPAAGTGLIACLAFPIADRNMGADSDTTQ